MKKYSLLFFTLFLSLALIPMQAYSQSCSAGYDCNERGVGTPGVSCGNGEWESLLVTQESGGNYGIKAPNTSATGRYQFINSTRNGIGTQNNLPCSGTNEADRQGFANCPGLQDDYAYALWRSDYQSLISNSSVANAVNSEVEHECPVTASGLVALSHNVGPTCARLWAQGGEAYMKANGPTFKGVPAGTPPCTDANGTNAVSKYACAMGGYDVSSILNTSPGTGGAIASGCGFGFTPADPPSVNFSNSDLIGCDPAVYDVAETMVNAQLERENELIKEFITKPTPVEQSTCLDQYTSLVSAAGGVHSNPGGNIDSSIIPIVQQPLENTLTNIASSIFDPLNAVINNQFADIFNGFGGSADSFNGLFGGGGGSINAPNADCDMQQAVWDAAQCIEIPKITSLSDIIGGRLDELAGRIDSAPETFLQAACGKINSGLKNSLGGLFNNVTDKYNDAAEAISQPLSDAASDLP